MRGRRAPVALGARAGVVAFRRVSDLRGKETGNPLVLCRSAWIARRPGGDLLDRPRRAATRRCATSPVHRLLRRRGPGRVAGLARPAGSPRLPLGGDDLGPLPLRRRLLLDALDSGRPAELERPADARRRARHSLDRHQRRRRFVRRPHASSPTPAAAAPSPERSGPARSTATAWSGSAATAVWSPGTARSSAPSGAPTAWPTTTSTRCCRRATVPSGWGRAVMASPAALSSRAAGWGAAASSPRPTA